MNENDCRRDNWDLFGHLSYGDSVFDFLIIFMPVQVSNVASLQ